MPPVFKTFFLTIFLTAAIAKFSIAQDAYEKSIGIRGGVPTGVSFKHFLEFAGAVEGIFACNFTNDRVFSLTGLYEYHFFLNYDTNFFVGGGLSLGANKDEFRVTAEAIGGIEYVFPRFPMSFSLDYKPAFNIFDPEFFFNEFALTVRYIL